MISRVTHATLRRSVRYVKTLLPPPTLEPSTIAERVSNFSKRYTMQSACLVAGIKGAGADVFSQYFLQQDATYDPQRTAAFALWSGGYCGTVLHLLYNRLFPRIFPLVAGGLPHPLRHRNILGMVAFDNFISSPWFFIPSYYILRETLRGFEAGADAEARSVSRVVSVALATYQNEFWSCMSLTWSMWIPLHFITFSGVVPLHFRVHWTACASFFTLAATSALQGRLEQRRAESASVALRQRSSIC